MWLNLLIPKGDRKTKLEIAIASYKCIMIMHQKHTSFAIVIQYWCFSLCEFYCIPMKLIWNFACRFVGMCAGCPLHASFIVNIGFKLGQKAVLFFRTMEKTCSSSVLECGIW